MNDAVKKMFASIEEKYGKPVAHWVEILKKSGLEKHGERINHLKKEYGFTHGFANLVAHEAKGTASGKPESADPKQLIKAMFSGKEDFLPLYQSIIEKVRSFGKDVVIAPKKSYVSLRRDVQFAILQPSSGKRFDIGLVIKKHDPNLEPAGSFNSMCTHRIRVNKGEDLDAETFKYLELAYNEAKRD